MVGAHFLPMGLAFGARATLLGGLCLLNALAGLWLSSLPLALFAAVDGALKVGIGLWLFLDPRHEGTPVPGAPRDGRAR